MSQQSLFHFFKPACQQHSVPSVIPSSSSTKPGTEPEAVRPSVSSEGQRATTTLGVDNTAVYCLEDDASPSVGTLHPSSATKAPISDDDDSPVRPSSLKRRRLLQLDIASGHPCHNSSAGESLECSGLPAAQPSHPRRRRAAASIATEPDGDGEEGGHPAASSALPTLERRTPTAVGSKALDADADQLLMTLDDSLLAQLDTDISGGKSQDLSGVAGQNEVAAAAAFYDELGFPPTAQSLGDVELPDHNEARMEMLNVHADTPDTDYLIYYRNQVPVASGPEGIMWKAFVDAYFAYCDRFDFPSWIDPRRMKDKQGRLADSPEFDMAKIQTPSQPNSLDHKMHFTPAMLQYWQVKSEYFDRIVFFKLGKFYEIFYTDACIMQALCDFKWMGRDEKAHVGFPEMGLHTFAQRAVNAGYTVTVVEQMETPAEMVQRRSMVGAGDNKPKAVRREVCEVYSQGTLAHAEMLGPQHNYLCALVFDKQLERAEAEASQNLTAPACLVPGTLTFRLREATAGFGFVLVDVCSAQFFYGYAPDEAPARPALRTLLSHTTPHEVVMFKQSIPQDVRSILRALPQSPQLSFAPASKMGTTQSVVQDMLASLLTASESGGDEPALNAEAKRKLLTDVAETTSAALAALMCLEYLDTLLLRDRILAVASIQPWAAVEGQDGHMTLDNTVMNALEIVESRTGGKEDTLFAHLNNCATPFGSRLLARWLTAPLMSKARICERQDAVDWLLENQKWLQRLRQGLKGVPDLERLTARTCARALQAERGAVMFSDTVDKKLLQFLELLEAFEKLQKLAIEFAEDLSTADSGRLGGLLRSGSQGGLFPPLGKLIAAIRSQVVESGGERLPTAGTFPEFDTATAAVERQKAELQAYLHKGELWERLGVAPCREAAFAHTKFRYEVSVSEKSWRGLKGSDVEMTSTARGVVRFHTADLKQMISELEALESRRTDALFPFLQSLCRAFHAGADHFRAAISLAAEVDVLGCFAFNADAWSCGPTCRPQILEAASERGRIKIKQGVHPLICHKVDRFVPNDFEIGTADHPETAVVITGPNMGGKSTLARQVALLVLMAQIGARVPAMAMELVPVDRIFARVGAYDAILEHRSTFFVELEETLNFLRHATPRSIGIVDEFGRGTSTEEGSALAAATIAYVAETLQSLCLFSTHFQDHIHAHVKDKSEVIRFAFMGFDVDDATKQVVFHYQFRDGLCPNSHGVQIAKLAGIPPDIIQDAEHFRDAYNPGKPPSATPGVTLAMSS